MRKLSYKEKKWIYLLFSTQFKGSDLLLKQIKNSLIIPHYNKTYISLKFNLVFNKENIVEYPYLVRVPVEMYCNIDNKVPIVFILHVINGYVDELEIFKADSTTIEHDFTITSYHNYINSELEI